MLHLRPIGHWRLRVCTEAAMTLPTEVQLWMKKAEARPLVRVNALCSLQCFGTDGRVAKKGDVAHKNLFHQSPEVLFQIGVGGEPEREPADPGSPGTTTILRPFFRDHPGEPVSEENFWTLWCKGRLTEADTPTIRLGATPSGLTSAHLHHSPFF